MANSADPDQLASSDLHCLQTRVYPSSAGQGLSPYEISGIAQENKYFGNFSYFIMKLYVMCTH